MPAEPRLTPEQRNFVITSLACFDTPTMVKRALKETFEVDLARQSVERLASVLDLYKLDVGTYPTTDQGLPALSTRPAGVAAWNGPYLKGETQPQDPWSHPYSYASPGRGGREFELCSRGPSGTATDEASGLICSK